MKAVGADPIFLDSKTHPCQSNSMKAPDFIKICGLSTKPSVDAVIDGGATHLGLIFFEKSPRNVTLELARDLSDYAGQNIAKVAVTVNAQDDFLKAISSAVKPDYFQLHGNETPDRVRDVAKQFNRPVIKALSVKSASDLRSSDAYAGIADMILLDARAPNESEIPGGNGVAFDWDVMDGWQPSVPYILSGGLNRANIDEALSKTGASRIDVSSGVESSPGVKDTEMIKEFLGHLHRENKGRCLE